jgi:hypothetical protein
MANIVDTITMILRIQQVDFVVAAVRTVVDAIAGAVDILDQYDSALLRTQFFLNEWGSAMPTEQISAFTRQVSLSTGITQQAAASTEAYLARFRASAGDIERATTAIANASLATGVSMEHIARGLEMARAGRGREFWRDLGIQVKGTEGQFFSLDQMTTLLDRHFGGFAEQFQNTLPGALNQTRSALFDMNEQLAKLFSPIIIGSARLLAQFFEMIANAAKSIGDSLGISLPDLGGGAGGLGGASSTGNPVEDYLAQIVQNTGPTGPLARALTGGGSFAATPGGAVGLRDFSQMMRAAR